jgi:hypothetical protein
VLLLQTSSVITLKCTSHLAGSNWVVALDLKGFGDSEKPFLASNYKDDVILEVGVL